MKIPPAKIASFLANLPDNINIFLAYGANSGLAYERLSYLARQWLRGDKNQFNLQKLYLAEINNKPHLLKQQMEAMPLLGDKIIIWIKAGNEENSISKPVKELLVNAPNNLRLLIEAAELPPSSSLRKTAETTDNMASMPCYEYSLEMKHKLLLSVIGKNFIQIDNTALQHLILILPNEHMLYMQELNKLISYIGDKKTINIDDIRSLIIEHNEASVEEWSLHVIAGDYKNANKLLKTIWDSGHLAIPLLRGFARHLARVNQCKNMMENGMNFKEATSSLKPPLFFTQEAMFKKAVTNYRLDNFSKYMEDILKLEHESKLSILEPRLLISQYFSKGFH